MEGRLRRPSTDLQSVALGFHGDGTPTRMSREKLGDRSAALACGLMRARSMSSLSGIVVTTARWS